MIFHRLGLLLGGTFLLAASLGAQAALVYDVRLEDGQNDYVMSPGDTITLDLFATVTGTDLNADEGFQDGYGSIVGTVGGATPNGVTGTLSASLADPFKSNGAQAGKPADLNADSVMDIGSSQTAANMNFLFARASRIQTLLTPGTTGTPTLAGDGVQFKLATITFTVDMSATLTMGATVNIAFLLPSFTGPTNIQALWQEDGVYKSARAGSASSPTVGSSVTISVIPEPSSALLLLGGLAACGLRRRRVA